jgi:hypothetical protein
VIEGEHSIESDLAAVNPGYGPDAPRSRRLNCGNCIVAYELRRQGFDVEASPRIGMPIDEWNGLFEEFERHTLTSGDSVGAVNEITQEILKWGDGARGTVYGAWNWSPNYGHFFSVEVRNKKVMFVDSQNGDNNVMRYFENMIPASIIYGRLDNLKPSINVKQAVRGRR